MTSITCCRQRGTLQQWRQEFQIKEFPLRSADDTELSGRRQSFG